MDPIELLEATRIEPGQSGPLLRFWRWLVPEALASVCVTKLGDLFLEDGSESIWFLDAGTGKLEKVAEDRAEWLEKLSDSEQRNFWSGTPLVARLEKAGLRLNDGQCYTYWQSPMMGGEYDVKNFKIVTIQQHFDIWGPLLESVKDLPAGARVRFEVVP